MSIEKMVAVVIIAFCVSCATCYGFDRWAVVQTAESAASVERARLHSQCEAKP